MPANQTKPAQIPSIQVMAGEVIANAIVLRSIAPSLYNWLEDACPGMKVASFVNEYKVDTLPEAALFALTDANKWIAVATIANAGKTDKEALTRSTAPSAMFSLIMPLLTLDQIKPLFSDNADNAVEGDKAA